MNYFIKNAQHTIGCLLLATLINVASSFTTMAPTVVKIWSNSKKTCSASSRISMVRNIDLPETLIFYGRHILLEDDNKTPKYGLQELLQECKEIETPAILIEDRPNGDESFVTLPKELDDDSLLQVFSISDENQQQARRPPNPRSLVNVMESTTIQPRGFGGSSGFGRGLADPPRPPLPQYVVVFGDCEDVCRAARYTGMRYLSVGKDSEFADAVVHDFNFYLDDIATPGSFWLNPSCPRDDDSNLVDPYEIIEWYESQGSNESNDYKKSAEGEAEEPLDEDEIERILADLDPL